ncbi:cubilin-like [Physella acuta]|uniref:cubilin-like n=1 Tax=Physella acuta TaxID=109671 RepID=UPI0027DE4F1D|nr:cubilin-like [Physella acuta]
MNTSTSNDCSSDYLQIFDGQSTSPRLFDKMCTTWQPLTVSTENNMHIVFRTTGRLQFIANYNIYGRHSTLYEIGKLASPGYPLGYLNNQEITWNLSARADSRLILNLSFVETESCGTDYITVYDGATKNAPSFNTFCGMGVSGLIVSTTNNFFVTFKTDSSETYRGFYGEFYSHDNHITLKKSQGNISSPRYPFGKLDNMIYTWTIQGKADSYIVLNILNFELRDNKQNDILSIFDGPTTFSPMFGSLTVKPELMASTGNSMFILLKNPKQGFNGTYEIRVVMLLRNLMPAKGICNGTRLTVTSIHRNVLECKAIAASTSQTVLIPRISLTSSDSNLSFIFTHRQFPVR